MGQGGGAAGGTLGRVDVAISLRGAALRQAGLQDFQAAGDAGEQIVEIMRDAAGQLTHRFHLLRLAQLFLRRRQRGGRRFFGADVASAGIDQPVRRRRDPGDAAVAAILVKLLGFIRRQLTSGRDVQRALIAVPGIRVGEIEMMAANHLLRRPAQHRVPGLVGGQNDALHVDHDLQVLGVFPGAVAFAGVRASTRASSVALMASSSSAARLATVIS